MNLNKAIIIGNITRDPELKALSNGNKVCSFSVATNRVWKDNNGQKQEQVEYHNIVVFGKQAENTAQYMKKGNQIMIEGRIQTRSWDKEDGTKAYKTEIIAENIQFGFKQKDEVTEQKTAQQRDEERPNETVMDLDGRELNLQDIPFN